MSVPTRGRWQGMLTILRFNWPFYAAAGVLFFLSIAGLCLPAPPLMKLACGLAATASGYFLLISLGVSHLVYDRSDLYRWKWLDRALAGAAVDDIVFCHSGFDETSESLRARLHPAGDWIVLDHFDAAHMTEPSIRRARHRFPPTAETVAARYDQWPVESGSIDIVFALLAIHEFRSEPERTAWFAEARRCLKPGGRIVMAEHVRDPANFIAFGPGFLHFHSPASWQRCWTAAGFRAADSFRITPWVRIFVLV